MRARAIIPVAAIIVVVTAFEPAEAAPCSIDAQIGSAEDVVIDPPGEAAFTLRLRHVPMEAKLSGTEDAVLHVLGPLRFTTEHPWNKLEVITRKRVSIRDGMLTLPRGMRPTLGLGSKHDSERSDVPARLPLRELLPETPIVLPCQELTVSKERSWSDETGELAIPKKAYLHATSSETFSLYPSPRSSKPWRIQFRGPLKVIKRSGDWVKLRADWQGGSRLVGWAKAKRFKIVNQAPTIEWEDIGTMGFGTCGRGHRRSPTPYVLKANAPIHTRPKGAIWAHTAGVIQVKAFALSRSDGWLQITEVDGLPPKDCADHRTIWVHATSIQWTDKPI